MSIPSGSKLGPYEILSFVGAGGMGEVYRARDPRLGRDVAIKVLPADRMADEGRRKRFIREARAASALNHPHIVTVHEVDSVDGIDFMVMEYLAGQTLASAIPRQGMRLDQLLRVAIPIADALTCAHAAGIVHRDLKPANVMVSTEGTVKVLDFGLAKRVGSRGGPESETDTGVGAPGVLSQPGAVAGTIGYMSPEQAAGGEVDSRSDVFSFGALLYEMATGRQAFPGRSAAEVHGALMKEQPKAPSELVPALPKELDRVVQRCLQKEPARRFQHTLDLKLELEQIKEETETGAGRGTNGSSEPSAPDSSRGRLGRFLLWIGAGVVLLAAFGWWTLRSRAPQAAAAPITITPFTVDGGAKSNPRLSPDGEKVAYAWTGPNDDNWDIYVKAVGQGTKPLRITEDPAIEGGPAWSPDGRQIAFARWAAGNTAAIYTIPALGGQERKLVDVVGPVEFGAAYTVPMLSWGPDGEWLVFGEKAFDDAPARIVRLSLATLDKRPLTSPPADSAGDFEPQVSPDGQLLAFVRSGTRAWGNQDVWVQPVGGGAARRLTSGAYDAVWALSWTPDGAEIVFSCGVPGSDVRLARVPLASGAAQPVVGVGEDAVDASVVGNRMVYVQNTTGIMDTWRLPCAVAPRSSGTPEKLLLHSVNAAYSPDGRKIAFESARGGVANLWLCNADGTHPVQVTTSKSESGTPRWSPDGQKLAFDSLEAGNWDLYVVGADGATPRRLTREPSEDGTGTWSRDGRWIYFHSDRTGHFEVWKVPSGGGAAVQVTRTGGFYAVESEDGRDLYYSKSGASGIWRVPSGGGEESEVVKGPVVWGDWALTRRALYYAISRDQVRRQQFTIQHLDLGSGRTSLLYRREGLFSHLFLTVSPDEKWLLFGEAPAPQSELRLMENFH